MKVLVTGGAGYIGSTIASALEDNGHTPIILDSLTTGTRAFIHGRHFFQGDISDSQSLEAVFCQHPDIKACIHCAALVVVFDSVRNPLTYYLENVVKSVRLVEGLISYGCHRIVFSSSASIYAPSGERGFEVDESSEIAPASPYARTKWMVEQILQDTCAVSPLQAISLRYFNPIGADPGYRSGVHVRQPSHVLGKLVDVALGKLPEFTMTGVNWPTRDGSGLRDYIHVYDLALAHVKALERFDHVLDRAQSTFAAINLGTGRGVTVRELVAAFERVYGAKIAVREESPRPGDVAGAYSSSRRALDWLSWSAQRSIEEGIHDALEWGKRRQAILGYP
jgi:UDP-glucose 4-epimerase